MIASIVALRWILRLAWLAGLILGAVLWTGHGYQYMRLHMWLGFVATLALLLIVLLSLLARVNPGVALAVLLWAVLLPAIGIAQLRLLPGPNHWIIRVIHLVIGLGAIGFGESLSKKVLSKQDEGKNV